MSRVGRERVLGPYRHSKGWVCQHITPSDDGGKGTTQHLYFTDEAEARKYKVLVEADLVRAATTIEEAFREYKTYLENKGNKLGSIKETLRRLRRFFPSHELPLDLLTPKTCERYYATIAEGLAADSHRNYLAEAKTFLRYAHEKKWVSSNPLEKVKGIGRRRKGKEQLRVDEARKWEAFAIAAATEGSDAALAAILTLVQGLRCSEVVNLKVRDIDDGGRLLWVSDSKTEAGKRTVEVSEDIRGLLVAHAKGYPGDALLFKGSKGKHDRAWPRHAVQEICRLVDVPVVTAHGMRGMFATRQLLRGVSPRDLASAMGHESFETTQSSYVAPGTAEQMARAQGMKVLKGGKR